MSGKNLEPKYRSVSDIKGKLMQPALTSHYEVYFHPPSEKLSKFINYGKDLRINNELTDLLSLSCSEASLPGSTLATHELNNDFTGVTQRHAYRRLYDDRADFTFYVNHEYTQIRFFETWMRFITGEDIKTANTLGRSYRVSYPKYYKTTINITKFERNIGIVGKDGKTSPNPHKGSKDKGARKIVYSFFNAFPVSVNSMPISYDVSQLLKITVSFSYDRYVAGDSSFLGTYSDEPRQTSATGAPKNPFELSPEKLSEINMSAFSQNINLGNFSPGTFTNTAFNPNYINESDIFSPGGAVDRAIGSSEPLF